MPTANWERLGELLVRRRIELNPRYANRRTFAAERGANPTAFYRTVNDVERGRRDNYEDTTITSLEVAYAVTPGSIARALKGGELEPLPPVPSPTPLVQAPRAGTGPEAEAKAQFEALKGRVNPLDWPLLEVLGRALDGEGEPMPWRQKLAIAQRYLTEFAEQENGNTGTALRAACAHCALRALITGRYGVMPAESQIDDNA